MNTAVKFTYKSGLYLTGNLLSDQVETEETISQRMHKTTHQQISELPIIGEKPPSPIPSRQIRIHEFTLFNSDGTQMGRGEYISVECDQVLIFEISSPTKP
jgi:hypothetical protein